MWLRSLISVLFIAGCASRTPPPCTGAAAPTASVRVDPSDAKSIDMRHKFDQTVEAHVDLVGKHHPNFDDPPPPLSGCIAARDTLMEWQKLLWNVSQRIVYTAANAGVALNRASLGDRRAHEETAVALYMRDARSFRKALEQYEIHRRQFQECQERPRPPVEPAPVQEREEPLTDWGPSKQAYFVQKLR